MTLELIKSNERHVIKFEIGDKQVVLDSLIEKVEAGIIDWFDAAQLSHQLGQLTCKPLVVSSATIML